MHPLSEKCIYILILWAFYIPIQQYRGEHMHQMGEGKQTLVNVCLKHHSNPSQINLLFVIIRTAGWCVSVCVCMCVGGLFCIEVLYQQ